MARVGIGLKAVAEEAAGQAASGADGFDHSRTSDQSWHHDFETPRLKLQKSRHKKPHMGWGMRFDNWIKYVPSIPKSLRTVVFSQSE